jgi:hypothetical protein
MQRLPLSVLFAILASAILPAVANATGKYW